MSVQPSKVKPSGLWYLMVALIFLAGVGGAVAATVSGALAYKNTIDDFARVPASGTATVRFAHPGSFSAYYEEPGISSFDVPSVSITMQPAGGGAPIVFNARSSTSTYNAGGHDGVSLSDFHIDRAGEYTVTTVGPAEGQVAMGRSPFKLLAQGVGEAALIGLLGFVIALIFLIVLARKRGNAKRALVAAQGGGYGYGAPGFAPQYAAAGYPGYGPPPSGYSPTAPPVAAPPVAPSAAGYPPAVGAYPPAAGYPPAVGAYAPPSPGFGAGPAGPPTADGAPSPFAPWTPPDGAGAPAPASPGYAPPPPYAPPPAQGAPTAYAPPSGASTDLPPGYVPPAWAPVGSTASGIPRRQPIADTDPAPSPAGDPSGWSAGGGGTPDPEPPTVPLPPDPGPATAPIAQDEAGPPADHPPSG